MPDFLIYGATGYTGSLIAREAARRGLRPILAGRSADKVAALAGELGLEHRAFALDFRPLGPSGRSPADAPPRLAIATEGGSELD